MAIFGPLGGQPLGGIADETQPVFATSVWAANGSTRANITIGHAGFSAQLDTSANIIALMTLNMRVFPVLSGQSFILADARFLGTQFAAITLAPSATIIANATLHSVHRVRPRTNTPASVVSTEVPWLSLVVRGDPSWARLKYDEVEYEFSGRNFRANPYTRGAYNDNSNGDTIFDDEE